MGLAHNPDQWRTDAPHLDRIKPMSKTIIASMLAASALFAGAAGIATAKPLPQTMTAAKVAPAKARLVKTATTKTTVAAAAKPAPTVKTHAAVATHRTTTKLAASSTPAGRMVTTKTTTGKSITYNCSKAGNATKKACK
jgi:hypothetical protein